MKLLHTIPAILLACTLSIGVDAKSKVEVKPYSVIPEPLEVTHHEGSADLAGFTFVVSDGFDRICHEAATELADKFTAASGKKSRVKAGDGKSKRTVKISKDPKLTEEEYTLNITPKDVRITASGTQGVLYALQTLTQLLPIEFFEGKQDLGSLPVPCVDIKDKPRFSYRGVLIDSGRHFFSVEEIKKCLDIMALYHENRFHWHLSEDQGWRIEIKKYPKLTSIGSVRHGTQVGYDRDSLDGVDYGGFYTQDQIRDVVEYAAKRGITVIPEIDLPGHMLSALAAYPELGCTGGPYEVATTWGVKKDVLCVGKEETFHFIEDVLTEVMELFPSEYINIGGDEVPKDRWNACPHCTAKMQELGLYDHDGHTAGQYLQNWVNLKVQAFLNSHGRKLIGWEEILEGDLPKGATIMSWKGTIENVDPRIWEYDCVMSPRSYMYIDRYQSWEYDREPLSIGAYLPVEDVYSYEPYDGVPEYGKARILGVQANLWTEFIGTDEYLEYMLLPRLAALSEVQWCAEDSKDYDRFRTALDQHAKLYEALGYTYCKYPWGIVGLPDSEQKARSHEELRSYVQEKFGFDIDEQ